MSLGRIDEARAEIEAFAAGADALALPHYRWWVPMWTAAFALMAGDGRRRPAWGSMPSPSATGPTTPTPSCSWASSASGAALSRPASPRPCSPRSSPPWRAAGAVGLDDRPRLGQRRPRAHRRGPATWSSASPATTSPPCASTPTGTPCSTSARRRPCSMTVRGPSASTRTWRRTRAPRRRRPGRPLVRAGRPLPRAAGAHGRRSGAGRAPPGGSARRGRGDRRGPAGGSTRALLHRAREEIGR